MVQVHKSILIAFSSIHMKVKTEDKNANRFSEVGKLWELCEDRNSILFPSQIPPLTKHSFYIMCLCHNRFCLVPVSIPVWSLVCCPIVFTGSVLSLCLFYCLSLSFIFSYLFCLYLLYSLWFILVWPLPVNVLPLLQILITVPWIKPTLNLLTCIPSLCTAYIPIRVHQ